VCYDAVMNGLTPVATTIQSVAGLNIEEITFALARDRRLAKLALDLTTADNRIEAERLQAELIRRLNAVRGMTEFQICKWKRQPRIPKNRPGNRKARKASAA